MTDRPTCACHGEPMWRAGKGRYGCAVRERARNARRIRMQAGGIEFYAGRAPTTEDATQIRTRIRRESPRAVRHA